MLGGKMAMKRSVSAKRPGNNNSSSSGGTEKAKGEPGKKRKKSVVNAIPALMATTKATPTTATTRTTNNSTTNTTPLAKPHSKPNILRRRVSEAKSKASPICAGEVKTTPSRTPTTGTKGVEVPVETPTPPPLPLQQSRRTKRSAIESLPSSCADTTVVEDLERTNSDAAPVVRPPPLPLYPVLQLKNSTDISAHKNGRASVVEVKSAARNGDEKRLVGEAARTDNKNNNNGADGVGTANENTSGPGNCGASSDAAGAARRANSGGEDDEGDGKASEEDDDDVDEDDDDDDDDDDDESNTDDDDDDDESNTDDDEEEVEDDDGDEDEDEDDDDDDDDDDTFGNATRSSSSSRQRAYEQITVKVSREGDRNVKVLFITRATKFASFARDIMRRFAYTRLSDFDMYCIDAAGDHVDIDVPRDFKNLVAQFLQTLRWERRAADRGGGESSLVGTSRRFSARETVRGSASLSRTGLVSHDGEPPVEEGDRSSTTVLRLYVRDSYRARRKEEQRRIRQSFSQLSLPPTAAAAKLQHPLHLQHVLGSPTAVSSVDTTSIDPADALIGCGSNLSAQLSHTVGNLAQTIGFREDEEVQWSKMGMLGKGSCGSVYEGITSEGKIMAVKVQEIPLDEDAEEVKVIQREINLMRSLKHKNIVAYYGCQTRQLPNGARQLEIFLEHCHGGSLSHLRRKFERAKERFSISLVRTYAKQVLEGLDYLHGMNVVHRDLKGENVLISSLGEAKLADFGCSKRIGTATMQQEACGERGAGYQTMVGTPLFMAPEVLNCEGGYTKPADVWSVGCLVLELLGRQPWTFKNNANAFQIMYHISKSTGMPTGVPKRCPASLYSFFEGCFTRDPASRSTAAELLQHEWITCPDNKLEEVLPDDE